MLSIKTVSKNFGPLQVLHQISLELEEKDIVGLAGSSGSGKSTLLRCIQGLENVDSGMIVAPTPSCFMFQDFQLFPHMNVLQNLVYAPKLHDKKADHQSRAMELLKALGMDHKVSALPHELSGGQKQRVALARSLMMNPKLLLCDEPTSGLDVATIMDVVTLLETVRKFGVTMVIASHDLDFLTKIADRIIILKQGEIAFDASPCDLENPIEHLKKFY